MSVKSSHTRSYGPYEITYRNLALEPRTVTIRQKLDGRHYREVVLSVQEWTIYKETCGGAISAAEFALRSDKSQLRKVQ